MTQHLVDGEWLESADKSAEAAFALACVARAAEAAEAAFAPYAALSDSARAEFLRAIGDEIEQRGDEITEVGAAETALPAARLVGERGRTVGQLRMFADLLGRGGHWDTRHDAALPERSPLPRPDLRLMHAPIGAVAVFGASNFPLAFSVAGGDTAAALAAGCAVVVKGHPAHPRTGEVVARAADAARARLGLPAGVFGFVAGGAPELSRALVAHPAIAAVGFTGSLRAGRALYNVACARETPIPFYAEMGSINPVFVLPAAAAGNGAAIARGWAQSLELGAGQFCTNPGVIFCPASAADDFVREAAAAASGAGHKMLTEGIADSYGRATAVLDSFVAWRGGGGVATVLMRCSLAKWRRTPALREEIFGPAGVVVTYDDVADLAAVADELAGQLTATLWVDEGSAADGAAAAALAAKLWRRAGRLICNGFPTGVEVASAMMHGGPYPAATGGATSVGELAIRRFLRPVCYQNFPKNLLPPPLQ